MKNPQLQNTLQPYSLIKKSEIKAENDTEKTCKFRPISSNLLHYKNYMDNQLKERKNFQSQNCRISQYGPIQLRNQDDFIKSSKLSSLTCLFNDQNDSKSSVQFDKYSSSSTKDLICDYNQPERLHHNQETFSNQLKVTKNNQNFFIAKSKVLKEEINDQNQNQQTSLMTEIQNQIKQERSQTIQNINELEKLILRVFALRFIRQDMYQYMMIYSKSQNPFSNFKYRQVELTNRIIKIEQ
ncbi:hypothetical protein PPERSA_03884 [Pseudocohnilembus persalinus]|uniref:Uncharacterized protein n=1 Tax=Pseudocohnilembus persalinus TaxID=266149 RepID=A0A0V0Q933_PSEPJ|nr:hypothetical protein PPERSA_03884 [Pseudocohnilembus persalinus]|eukprot:KRW98749.1 hypothetical protein PPERSA_03884 [Pseudocohnilembus persalinus]